MANAPILFDGSGAILYRGTGIGTYTWQLAAQLQKYHADEIAIALPGREYDGFRFDEDILLDPLFDPGNETALRRHYFGSTIAATGATLCHIPQNGIGLPPKKCCKETVTIHDLIPYLYPETVGKGYLKEFLREMPKIIDRADGIITVSARSKADILRVFDYPANRITVIAEAPEPLYRPIEIEECRRFLREHHAITDDFIIYVGGFSPRKNIKGLILAVYLLKKEGRFPFHLVLPGKRQREHDALTSLISALGLEETVIFPDFVPTRHLPYFYGAAQAMVYPSLYEGFGLPPLEAMACGTPVIAANTSSLPEVLGDAALYCDPLDAADIAAKIDTLLTDDALRHSLAAKGQQKASTYTWKKTAAATINFWRQILATP